MKKSTCNKIECTSFEELIPYTLAIGFLIFLVFVAFSLCSLPYYGGVLIFFGPTLICALLLKSGCELCEILRKLKLIK